MEEKYESKNMPPGLWFLARKLCVEQGTPEEARLQVLDIVPLWAREEAYHRYESGELPDMKGGDQLALQF